MEGKKMYVNSAVPSEGRGEPTLVLLFTVLCLCILDVNFSIGQSGTEACSEDCIVACSRLINYY